jgi:hypothetical protein
MTPVINLLLVTMTPSYTLNKRKINSISVYCNCNQVASKQNMDKLSISKFFSFIAEVVVTGDLPLHSSIFTNFHKKLKLLP